jgi:hypothetical protein
LLVVSDVPDDGLLLKGREHLESRGHNFWPALLLHFFLCLIGFSLTFKKSATDRIERFLNP